MSVSWRIEDYLEAILAMEIEKGRATVTELAQRVSVSKATVVATCRKLMDAALLEHEQYGDLRLTEEGKSKALEIYRRHEHLTYLFAELLEIERSRAQKIACAMEHELDRTAELRLLGLVEYLAQARREKSPWFKELFEKMTATEEKEELSIPLVMTEPHKGYRVARVTAEQEQRLALAEQGIHPGATLEYVEHKEEHDKVFLEMKIHEGTLSLPREQAVFVWVEDL